MQPPPAVIREIASFRPSLATLIACASGAIGPRSNVLVIGDSHTCGTFGEQLDHDLRATGARVETYGSAASSPSWWIDGTITRWGFVARHADGSVEQPQWNLPHVTPRLEALMAQQNPDVVIVILGANMRKASAEEIARQVEPLAKLVTSRGARLIWVGPPKTRDDMASPTDIDAFDAEMRRDPRRSDRGSCVPTAIDAFDAEMQKAVAPFGTYLPSSGYTRYAGRDGIHYSGAEGTPIAREWADRIFDDIQGR